MTLSSAFVRFRSPGESRTKGVFMPVPSPFHERIVARATSHEWREWAGYLAPALYGATHEYEYYAIRNAAALIDISPLYKYAIRGPDAAALLDRIVTRDIGRCKVGRVRYTPWCDEAGKVLDDGTVARLAPDHFRVTAADPNFRYFEDCAYGFDAEVEDISEQLAALALQGPRSRAILEEVVHGVAFHRLPFFHLAEGTIGAYAVTVTRTGYTGDLGYELWFERKWATYVWDILIEVGERHGITPTGLV
ncbi:MAG: aminomethyl transferase family protein, partial [Deltaproteobacteria bacterium]